LGALRMGSGIMLQVYRVVDIAGCGLSGVRLRFILT
jgi:hypothetical protein